MDDVGNLTARGTATLAYDQANRLTRVAPTGGTTPTAEYAYDGDGRRTSSTVGAATTRYLHDTNRSLQMLLDDGRHVYPVGLREPAALLTGNTFEQLANAAPEVPVRLPLTQLPPITPRPASRAAMRPQPAKNDESNPIPSWYAAVASTIVHAESTLGHAQSALVHPPCAAYHRVGHAPAALHRPAPPTVAPAPRRPEPADTRPPAGPPQRGAHTPVAGRRTIRSTLVVVYCRLRSGCAPLRGPGADRPMERARSHGRRAAVGG